MNHQALIAVGSNLGDRTAALKRVLQEFQRWDRIHEFETSALYETLAIGGSNDQPSYLNAVIRVATEATAAELHQFLMDLESQLGRQRRGRWESRTMDLDLLLFGDQVIQTRDLVVPHPRMSFRRFVLRPAVDVAANWIHPICQVTIERLLHQIDRNENRIVVLLESAKTSDDWLQAVRQTSAVGGKLQFDSPIRPNSEASTLIGVYRPIHTRGGDYPHVAGSSKTESGFSDGAEAGPWQIHLMNPAKLAVADMNGANLAVTLALQPSGATSQWIDRNWRGPRLDLPTTSPDVFVTELCAAIEAMRPWDERHVLTRSWER